MFSTDSMTMMDAGQMVRVRIGDQCADLSYVEALSLVQALEKWLQTSADDNIEAWAFPHRARVTS